MSDELVRFGDFTLIRSAVAPRIVFWYARCGQVLVFHDREQATRVDTRIRFHGIVCWDCNRAA